MADEFDILIGEAGDVSFVYSDDLAEVFVGEPQTTTRASNVEPHPLIGSGWIADMTPVDGPVLGANGTEINVCDRSRPDAFCYLDKPDIDAAWMRLVPFTTRQAALDAERQWLREHKGL